MSRSVADGPIAGVGDEQRATTVEGHVEGGAQRNRLLRVRFRIGEARLLGAVRPENRQLVLGKQDHVQLSRLAEGDAACPGDNLRGEAVAQLVVLRTGADNQVCVLVEDLEVGGVGVREGQPIDGDAGLLVSARDVEVLSAGVDRKAEQDAGKPATADKSATNGTAPKANSESSAKPAKKSSQAET